MSSGRQADSPGRQLKRVQSGQAVGVITLPDGSRILADGKYGRPQEALLCRLNAKGAYCWDRVLYASALKRHLKVADGDIETAGTRSNCEHWPSKFSDVGRDKR